MQIKALDQTETVRGTYEFTITLIDPCVGAVPSSVTKPSIENVQYNYGADKIEFTYPGFTAFNADNCSFEWTYSAKLAGGANLDDDYITFDQSTLTFTVESPTAPESTDTTMEIVLTGDLVGA